MIARQITYFGQQAVVICDAKCSKAWGINCRPRITLSDDPDDYALLADNELGEAPADPGTYEGSDAKPTEPADRLNRWCVRECERSAMSEPGKANETVAARDFSRRLFNQPWKHSPHTPASGALKIYEADMSNEKIMVTVTVPEGLRAVVDLYDDEGGREQMQQATVTSGQTQQFFVDRVRRISVKEGFPQFIVDALDRKPDSE